LVSTCGWCCKAQSVALLSLGAAVFALGWAPRAVTAVGALPVVGSGIVWVLAETLNWPDWLGQISPFAHIASVPATSPNWAGVWIMLALGAAVAVLGDHRFRSPYLRG
jgi:polyether ionophore transport system permease protein